MKRLLILLSALPIVVTFIAAHWFGVRVLRRGGKLSVSLGECLEKLRLSEDAYEFKSMVWAGAPIHKSGKVYLSKSLEQSCQISDIAQSLLRVGMGELYGEHEKVIKWRLKMVKMGYLLPPFAAIACIFGTVVGRIPAMWSVSIIALCLAVCCVMLWLSKSVEKEAAKAIIHRLDKTHAIPRLTEQEALEDAIKAWVWMGVVPGLMIKLLLRKPKPSTIGG